VRGDNHKRTRIFREKPRYETLVQEEFAVFTRSVNSSLARLTRERFFGRLLTEPLQQLRTASVPSLLRKTDKLHDEVAGILTRQGALLAASRKAATASRAAAEAEKKERVRAVRAREARLAQAQAELGAAQAELAAARKELAAREAAHAEEAQFVTSQRAVLTRQVAALAKALRNETQTPIPVAGPAGAFLSRPRPGKDAEERSSFAEARANTTTANETAVAQEATTKQTDAAAPAKVSSAEVSAMAQRLDRALRSFFEREMKFVQQLHPLTNNMNMSSPLAPPPRKLTNFTVSSAAAENSTAVVPVVGDTTTTVGASNVSSAVFDHNNASSSANSDNADQSLSSAGILINVTNVTTEGADPGAIADALTGDLQKFIAGPALGGALDSLALHLWVLRSRLGTLQHAVLQQNNPVLPGGKRRGRENNTTVTATSGGGLTNGTLTGGVRMQDEKIPRKRVKKRKKPGITSAAGDAEESELQGVETDGAERTSASDVGATSAMTDSDASDAEVASGDAIIGGHNAGNEQEQRTTGETPHTETHETSQKKYRKFPLVHVFGDFGGFSRIINLFSRSD
jgi:hypothetical protein